MADRQARARWPVEVQRRAEELGRDRDLSGVDVRRAIGEELGADVPMSTVCRWVADVRRREPIDRRALLSDVADRATVLLSAELARQERQSPTARDLARIDAVARTLKILSSVETSKQTAGRQTLADLSAGTEPEETQGRPMHAAA
jgi:hypothetical protein